MNETDISTTVDTAEARVARGLAWLLDIGPGLGWDVDAIDRDSLDMSRSDRCAMAQVAGVDYFEALAQAEEVDPEVDSVQWAMSHGFDFDTYAGAQELTRLWALALNAERV